MDEIQEFIDKRGSHRLRVIAKENFGDNIIHSSTQGYDRKEDCITASVRSARALLTKYGLKY